MSRNHKIHDQEGPRTADSRERGGSVHGPQWVLPCVFSLILSVLSSVGPVHGQTDPATTGGKVSVAIRMSDSLHVITDHMEIDRGKMVGATGIVVLVDGADMDVDLKVVGFALSSVVNGSPIEAVSLDENFTAEQKRIIRTAPRGSNIYLERIRAMYPHGRVYSVGSQVMVVR